MKILVPTPVMPMEKSLRINYITPIIKSLKKKQIAKIIWLVYQPQKFTNTKNPDFEVYDIHDFQNAVDCLKILNPDCIMVGKDLEPIQLSLSLAATHLKIPLISFIYQSYEIEKTKALKKYNQLIAYSRILSSSGVPTDSSKDHHFLRRFRFIIYKLKFLQNTQTTLKIKNSTSFGYFIKFLMNLLMGKEFPINTVSDLYLLPDSTWNNHLKSLNISNDKFSIIGNPILDQLYEKYENQNFSLSPNKDILIVTDALIHHGICSKKELEGFLIKVISKLQNNNFTFSFKIHPASEDKNFYLDILKKLNIPSQIYQRESLWDIVDDFHLILSFGASTIHTEIALMGRKMIFIDSDFDLPLMDFVQEGMNSGNIIKCHDISFLEKSINKILKTNLQHSESFIQKRNNFIFGFDGKSSLRASNAILQILKNRENH